MNGTSALGRNRMFWFVGAFVCLLVLVCIYLLDQLHQEHLDRIFRTSVLSIPAENDFYFGREKIVKSEIALKVKAFDDTMGANQTIHVSLWSDVRFATLVSVVSAIQDAGHDKIGVPTLFKEHSQLWDSISSEILVTVIYPGSKKQRAGSLGARPMEATDNRWVIPTVKLEDMAGSGILITLNSQPLPTTSLTSRIRQLLIQTQDKTVYVLAEEKIDYGTLIEIMLALKLGGAERLGFLIDNG